MTFPPHPASGLAENLARRAEAVCRHYLANGRKQGRYWLAGNVSGAPGHSLYVRLAGPGSGKGAAGKWTDAATGEHGDLLDLVRLARGLSSLREAMDEARAFLRLPAPEPAFAASSRHSQASGPTTPESARRMFEKSLPVAGTLAEDYLRHRGIACPAGDLPALRFHPRCTYREDGAPARTFPALVAAVTGAGGEMTGVHRTWLHPEIAGAKAPVETPRRAMGDIFGNGVRFGQPPGVAVRQMVAGEGIETVLSLRPALPGMPMVAATSANHLAVLRLPPQLRRLLIAVDADEAGHRAMARLRQRAEATGIEVLALLPCHGDFNEDLQRLGPAVLARNILDQIGIGEVARAPTAA